MPLQPSTFCRCGIALLLIGGIVGCGQHEQFPHQPIVGPEGKGVQPFGLPPGQRMALATSLPTPPSIVRLDLTNPVVTKIDGRKYHASVGFDFVRGWPDTSLVYAINIHFIGTSLYEVKRFVGTDLHKLNGEGTLEWDFEVEDLSSKGMTVVEPGEYTIFMAESENRDGKSGFVSRSNWLTSNVAKDGVVAEVVPVKRDEAVAKE